MRLAATAVDSDVDSAEMRRVGPLFFIISIVKALDHAGHPFQVLLTSPECASAIQRSRNSSDRLISPNASSLMKLTVSPGGETDFAKNTAMGFPTERESLYGTATDLRDSDSRS